MVRAIMIQGTGSNVGKSVLVAGLARAYTRRGFGSRRSNRKTCRTTLPSPKTGAKLAARRPFRPVRHGGHPTRT